VRDGLSVHSLRLGAGLAAGAALPGRAASFWLGARVLPQAVWIHARDSRQDTTWMASSELGVLAQLRLPSLMLGLHAGIELNASTLTVTGERAQIRWTRARLLIGLTIALMLPARPALHGT
jgi:hypothetical protein